MKMFETWTFKGTRFLAAFNKHGHSIIDEHGNNYGSWFSPASFKRNQQTGKCGLIIGKALLSVRSL